MNATMRVTDLLGSEVRDEHGRRVGRVHDVRMVREGPRLQPVGQPAYRVRGLIVGLGAVGRRLGYAGPSVTGPWLLKVVFGFLARRGRYIEWQRVQRVQDGVVTVRGDASVLPRVPALEDMSG